MQIAAQSIFTLFDLVCAGTRNNPSCTTAINDVNTNEHCHITLQGNIDMGCVGNCRTLLQRVTDFCSDEVSIGCIYLHNYNLLHCYNFILNAMCRFSA